MARFTDPNKWEDKWFRKLKPSEKLLWIYLCDKCDNAGFVDFDPELCAFITGMKEEHVLGAIKGLSRGLIGAGDELYFIRNFLRHQKNLPLNSENNAHKQIIRIIEEKISAFDAKDQGAIKGLISSTGRVRVKVKDKGEVVYTEDFTAFWDAYPRKVGKGDAFEQWNKIKGRPSVEELIQAVKKQQRSEDWTKERGKYIPHPSTWLHQRRWEDEVDVRKSEKPYGYQ